MQFNIWRVVKVAGQNTVLNECVLSLEYGRLLPAVSAWWGISVNCDDGLSVNMSLLPSSGVGEFGGATGRSSVDPAPL